MPPEDIINVLGNGRYVQIASADNVINPWQPLTRTEDDLLARINKIDSLIREIELRLDNMCIDAEELRVLKEQVSLLELLKSDTESD